MEADINTTNVFLKPNHHIIHGLCSTGMGSSRGVAGDKEVWVV